MKQTGLADAFERLYAACNRRELIHPDPLEFVYRFDEPRDREVAGLIAACLAYGRVTQILDSSARVLSELGPSPSNTLRKAGPGELAQHFRGFKHRWTAADDLVALLSGIGEVLRRHGRLEACFLAHHDPATGSTVAGLQGFARELCGASAPTSLVPAPAKGSACKRLHLYLRWMVRRDRVDPGCWQGIPPAALLIPLDTHMHRVARMLGLTSRKQANLRTAQEITEAFRAFAPDDPVRYDFALTRLGIRSDMNVHDFLKSCWEQRRGASRPRRRVA